MEMKQHTDAAWECFTPLDWHGTLNALSPPSGRSPLALSWGHTSNDPLCRHPSGTIAPQHSGSQGTTTSSCRTVKHACTIRVGMAPRQQEPQPHFSGEESLVSRQVPSLSHNVIQLSQGAFFSLLVFLNEDPVNWPITIYSNSAQPSRLFCSPASCCCCCHC